MPRRGGAEFEPAPHRLEPFRGEFVSLADRLDPKTFQINPIEKVISIVERQRRHHKTKKRNAGLTEWEQLMLTNGLADIVRNGTFEQESNKTAAENS